MRVSKYVFFYFKNLSRMAFTTAYDVDRYVSVDRYSTEKNQTEVRVSVSIVDKVAMIIR